MDVVGGAAPGDGPGSACIVADHPAEGAAVLCGRIRAEPQPVRRGRPLEGAQHNAGLHNGGPAVGIERHDAVEVSAEVEDQSGPDRVARHGGSGPTGGHRKVVGAADLHDRRHVLVGAREHHHIGHDAVVGGVGAVLGPASGAVVHLARDPRVQRGDRRGQIVGTADLRHPADTTAPATAPASVGRSPPNDRGRHTNSMDHRRCRKCGKSG
ncbi:D-lactate dehydrogenase domain protein [Rhodococcus sp. MTM3W5.2]|nr:D-lactate dehydrogenase domain protein [Rhodococcus sp. MTM3W5.2]